MQNQIKNYVLSHYLVEYPDNASFDEVMELIEQESNQVVIWEPFEGYSARDVIDYIFHMAHELEELFKKLKS